VYVSVSQPAFHRPPSGAPGEFAGREKNYLPKKYQISLEELWEFLSGNCQYWTNLCDLIFQKKLGYARKTGKRCNFLPEI
jgi:hypothetical protein